LKFLVGTYVTQVILPTYLRANEQPISTAVVSE